MSHRGHLFARGGLASAWARIPIMVFILSMAAVSRADESRDSDLPPPGVVWVEQADLVPEKPPSKEFKMRPYAQRRPHWGILFGFAYSTYQPVNYTPAFTIQDFGSIYGTPTSPLIEGQFVVKRNFAFGSIGAEIGYGTYDNGSKTIQVDSELKITQERIGVIVILDTLFSEPYAAPYASAGGYVMQFDESVASNDFKGSTQIAPYATIGVMAQLDWIDKDAATLAYENSRMQGTYLFAEVRKYFQSSKARDPALESDLAPGGGLRIEF